MLSVGQAGIGALMSTYVVGDLQGCLPDLQQLLDKLNFEPARDQLWLTGDLVNRGPDSLGSLRFIKSLGDSARTVLGNHDLHLLAIAAGVATPKRKDTLDDILRAPDCGELMDWLAIQPLIIHCPQQQVYMSHAGLYPGWSAVQALGYAREVEAVLADPTQRPAFFQAMYGAEPAAWSDALQGFDRLRFITNACTRMRVVSRAAPYQLDMQFKEAVAAIATDQCPWFERAQLAANERWLFGHWAALEAHSGQPQFIALDSGCVWGRHLTAYCLESGQITTSR